MWNVLILDSGSAAGSFTVVVCVGGTAPVVVAPVAVAIVRIWNLKTGRVAAKSREVLRRAAIVEGRVDDAGQLCCSLTSMKKSDAGSWAAQSIEYGNRRGCTQCEREVSS